MGRCRTSIRIAKPNTRSWMTGMPSIIARVARSRRIWMNSFQMMDCSLWRVMPARCGVSRRLLLALLDGDEDVLQALPRPETRLHLDRASHRFELSPGEKREPVELLGFVHVMRGHDHRRARIGEAADDAPEEPPRRGIDAG